MKKIILNLLLISAALIYTTTEVQAQYEKGDKLLNVTAGLNSYYSGGIPLGVALEVGVTDEISAGGSINYLSSNYSGGYGFTATYIGGRASYHVNKLLNLNNDKIDLYGGAGLGYRKFGWKDDAFGSVLGGSYGSGIYFGGFIGGRYYFNSKMAGLIELGAGGSSNANVGLTFKF